MSSSQTITVLFTDLVGSTELSSRLGPGEADDLRQVHFRLLRGAIQGSGGTEIKNLGDGLMVVFTSLSRALAGAVAMQQAIERHNRRSRQPLSIRIGLSLGEATEEDGDYFGEPVIEASRLCEVASGGDILANEIVRTFAGRHATQEFVPAGNLELKGLPEPVAAVSVKWEPDSETDPGVLHLALPTRLVGGSAESLFAFFGRAHELAHLEEVQKVSAEEAVLQAVLISGEPGIGKTSLVAQSARSAHGSGANILYGSCEEDLAVPYKPWVAALSPLVEKAPLELLQEHSAANGLVLARLLPNVAARLGTAAPGPGSEPEAEQYLILEGIVRLLTLFSAETPLIIVLDDLQWVDAASLQLLRHLIMAPAPMRVLVTGTFRESELSRSHHLSPVLADLRRVPRVHRLSLAGLDEVEILDLLEAAAGHTMDEEGVALAHALRRETAGNPFFLVEVIRNLGETGAFVLGADGRWRLSTDLDDMGMPSSVREVVGHRVARLGADTERSLSLAAVIGMDFDLDLLSALAGEDQDALLDLLEAATNAGLIAEVSDRPGHYRFVHALIQHTLYQDMQAARRQRTHYRIAEILEATSDAGGDRVAELARHWLAATRPTDTKKALYYARLAGEAAVAACSPLDAIEWYSRALDLLSRHGGSDDRERCQLLVGLGKAEHQAGRPEHRETLLEAAAIAQRLGDTSLLVDAALGARRRGRLAVTDDDQLRVLEVAFEALGDQDPARKALLLTAIAEVTDGRMWERRRELTDQALAIADRLPDEMTALEIALSCSFFRCQPELAGEQLAGTEAAMALAGRLDDPDMRMRALFNRIQACAQVGDIAEADQRIGQLAALVHNTRLPFHTWELRIIDCWRSVMSSDLTEAETILNEVLEIGTSLGAPEALAVYGGVLYQIRRQQGRLGEIVDLFDQAAAENPAIGSLRSALVEMYLTVGRTDEARQLFQGDAATGFRDFPRDATWTTAMQLCADNAVELGHLDAARVLRENLGPFEDLLAATPGTVDGSLARPLGRVSWLLGDDDEAERLLCKALEVHERIEAPYLTARTKLDYSDLLQARGGEQDRIRVEQLSSQALTAAERYGFSAIERRARALLDLA